MLQPKLAWNNSNICLNRLPKVPLERCQCALWCVSRCVLRPGTVSTQVVTAAKALAHSRSLA